ncbi:MAG: hypothetical protein Pg6C_17200 [Treponemataceae bacterium]|nr:MAG: hypothetical protein Pg6C_17200 [Treponemataceae bacterium]
MKHCAAFAILLSGAFFPLQAEVAVDFNSLPHVHLFVFAGIVFAAFTLLVVVFSYGITFKWGNKEITVGGIKRLLSKKDDDMLLKESLKRFSDEIDNDIEADIYDLIDDIDTRIENVLLREHCYFTFNRFISIIKKELYKRVRRNNLKERLSKEHRDKYIEKMILDIDEKYDVFRVKASIAKCNDIFSEFKAIKNSVRDELTRFVADAVEILVSGMKKKIERYENAKPEFKTDVARRFCCDDCITKNKAYIKNLTGMEV